MLEVEEEDHDKLAKLPEVVRDMLKNHAKVLEVPMTLPPLRPFDPPHCTYK